MVNSARPVVPPPPLLNPDPALTSPTPGSLLASVAARRTDLLYTEFYKNLLKTAVKSQPLRSPNNIVGTESKTPPKFSGTSPTKSESTQDTGRISNLDNYTNPANQLRNFYEGLYGRLTPNDYLLRLRAEQNHGCIPEFRGNKNVTSSSSTKWPLTSSESVSAFSRVSSLKPPKTSLNRLHLHQAGSFTSYDMKTRTSHEKNFKFNLKNSNSPAASENSLSPSTESAITPDVSSSKKLLMSPPSSQENCSPRSNTANSVIASDSSDGRPSSAHSSSERLKRKRRLVSCGDTCPVCGITVRDSEMKQHLAQEIGKLDKIAYEVYRNNLKKHAHAARRLSGPTSSHLSMHSETSIAATTSKKHDDTNDNENTSKENRFRTFQKVRGNRLDRFNSRVGQCRPAAWRNGGIFSGGKPMAPWLDYNGNSMGMHSNGQTLPGRFEGVRCPVCEISLGHMTSHEQISEHVMQCVGTRDGNGEQDTTIDVEDDEGTFEEYEWCGETRVRATTLVHKDLLASTPGFQVMQNAENDDSDQDLNVDTDETFEYGVVQFGDKDLVPPSSSDDENNRKSSHDHNGEDSGSQNKLFEGDSSHSNTIVDNMDRRNMESHSPSIVVQALRLKIQELESSSQDNRCLICMESYKSPLVSIQCWHVHCEKCWMRALGVKKLCPQCNMITPASHLRRIFL